MNSDLISTTNKNKKNELNIPVEQVPESTSRFMMTPDYTMQPTRLTVPEGVLVDATSTGTTYVYRSLPGKRLVIDSLYIYFETFGTGKTVNAIFNMGSVGVNYNDFFSAQTVSNVTEGYFVRYVSNTNARPTYEPNSDLYINITTASDASIEDWKLHLFGFYI